MILKEYYVVIKDNKYFSIIDHAPGRWITYGWSDDIGNAVQGSLNLTKPEDILHDHRVHNELENLKQGKLLKITLSSTE